MRLQLIFLLVWVMGCSFTLGWCAALIWAASRSENRAAPPTSKYHFEVIS